MLLLQGCTEGTQGHPSPVLLAWAQDQLSSPTNVPHTLVPACHPPLQQGFWVLTASPSDAHPRAGTAHLSTRREGPCLPAVAALVWDQHRQGEHCLPPATAGDRHWCKRGRKTTCFLQVCFVLGFWGFSVCFLWASFSSVHVVVVWHHICQGQLCSRPGISPQEHHFSLREVEQTLLLWEAALAPPNSVAGPLEHTSPRLLLDARFSAGTMRVPRNPVPPSFMQMMTRPWHWEALDSPAHGSVRALSCKAGVALMSLALI